MSTRRNLVSVIYSIRGDRDLPGRALLSPHLLLPGDLPHQLGLGAVDLQLPPPGDLGQGFVLLDLLLLLDLVRQELREGFVAWRGQSGGGLREGPGQRTGTHHRRHHVLPGRRAGARMCPPRQGRERPRAPARPRAGPGPPLTLGVETAAAAGDAAGRAPPRAQQRRPPAGATQLPEGARQGRRGHGRRQEGAGGRRGGGEEAAGRVAQGAGGGGAQGPGEQHGAARRRRRGGAGRAEDTAGPGTARRASGGGRTRRPPRREAEA